MLFGRRKPGYTTTVDGSADPEQAVLELQKAELAAKKKPKAEVFDIDAASETARRLKETGSTFDGSAAKTGEDVIAAVERETAELAAKQAAEAAPEAAEAAQPGHAKRCPAAQRRNGNQTERIEPGGKPRAVVGAQGKYPGGQPQAHGPGKILLPHAPPGQFGRGHPQKQGDNCGKGNG